MTLLPVEHLVQRIARVHRNLVMELPTMSAWCFEAMEQHAPYDQLLENFGVSITVTDGIAHLPTNIYKLLSVSSSCGRCDEACYTRNSRCLHFPLYTSGTALISYLAFPADERGYALIDDVFMEVCHYYCLKMLLTGPAYEGSMPMGILEKVEADLGMAEARARGSFRNIPTAKLNRINRLIRSSVIAKRFSLR